MMQSKSSSPRKLLPFIALSFAMMFGTFLLPAYGQQDVDPTWFNPWAPPAPAVAQTAQPQAAKSQQHPAKLKSASTTQTAKVRGKKSAKRPS